jgi:hypothetical protein
MPDPDYSVVNSIAYHLGELDARHGRPLPENERSFYSYAYLKGYDSELAKNER